MHSTLLIMTWVLLDPLNHKVGQAQLQLIVKWKCSIQDGVPAGPESMSKLHEQEAQSHLSSTTVARVPPLQFTLMTILGEGTGSWSAKRGGKAWAWFRDGLIWNVGTSQKKKRTVAALQPHSWEALKDSRTGKSFQGADLWVVDLAIYFGWKEKWSQMRSGYRDLLMGNFGIGTPHQPGWNVVRCYSLRSFLSRLLCLLSQMWDLCCGLNTLPVYSCFVSFVYHRHFPH